MTSVSVVDTVAVISMMEVQSDCSDRARAEAALAASMSSARAPRRTKEGSSVQSDPRWRLHMRVDSAAPGIKAADAWIEDDTGRRVAERSVSDKSTTCTALARAVGAWAQIVLDDELVRVHEEGNVDAALPEEPPIVTTSSAHRVTDVVDRPPQAESNNDETPPLEIGTTLFLRNGVAANGGIFGASPFVSIGLTRKLVLRTSFMIGTSTSKVPPDASQSANLTMIGGRVDVCRRFPGNYLDHRGIEFDGCAGTDVAYLVSDLDRAFRVSVGPSVVVRGELGSNFGIEVRGMVGANLARSGLGPDAPFIVGSAELGASVRFQ